MSEPAVANLLDGLRTTTLADSEARLTALLHPAHRDAAHRDAAQED